MSSDDGGDDVPPMCAIKRPRGTSERVEALSAALRTGKETWKTLPSDDRIALIVHNSDLKTRIEEYGQRTETLQRIIDFDTAIEGTARPNLAAIKKEKLKTDALLRQCRHELDDKYKLCMCEDDKPFEYALIRRNEEASSPFLNVMKYEVAIQVDISHKKWVFFSDTDMSQEADEWVHKTLRFDDLDVHANDDVINIAVFVPVPI